jgi:hypothetical protein
MFQKMEVFLSYFLVIRLMYILKHNTCFYIVAYELKTRIVGRYKATARK